MKTYTVNYITLQTHNIRTKLTMSAYEITTFVPFMLVRFVKAFLIACFKIFIIVIINVYKCISSIDGSSQARTHYQHFELGRTSVHI